jgi:hypothetical protein
MAACDGKEKKPEEVAVVGIGSKFSFNIIFSP